MNKDIIQLCNRIDDREKLLKMYRKANVFIMPSFHETFGLVYSEATANGKAVIECTGEGIEDFVEDGKTGILVEQKDVDILVRAMDCLLGHPDKTKTIGERARKLVMENYTWEKMPRRLYKYIVRC